MFVSVYMYAQTCVLQRKINNNTKTPHTYIGRTWEPHNTISNRATQGAQQNGFNSLVNGQERLLNSTGRKRRRNRRNRKMARSDVQRLPSTNYEVNATKESRRANESDPLLPSFELNSCRTPVDHYQTPNSHQVK
jgi:hypothetical protein